MLLVWIRLSRLQNDSLIFCAVFEAVETVELCTASLASADNVAKEELPWYKLSEVNREGRGSHSVAVLGR